MWCKVGHVTLNIRGKKTLESNLVVIANKQKFKHFKHDVVGHAMLAARLMLQAGNQFYGVKLVYKVMGSYTVMSSSPGVRPANKLFKVSKGDLET